MKYSYCFIIFLLLLNRCNMPLCEIAQEQGAEGVEEIRLFHGDTESLVRTGNPNLQRLCKGRFFYYHPNDDTVYSQFIMESGAGYGTIISGHIVESVMDRMYLLADRKPLDSVFGPLQTLICPFDSNSTFRGRPKEPLTNLNDYNAMIEKALYHDYWIINLETSDVYGPLSIRDYLLKKDELGVSKEIKLSCEL